MIITATLLTSGTALLTDTPQTASITPSGGKLIVLTTAHIRSAGIGAVFSPCTGNGLNYELRAHRSFHTVVNTNCLIAVYVAMGQSPTTGAITIPTGNINDADGWSVVEFDLVSQRGQNGGGAIVQTTNGRTNMGTSLSMTLNAFSGINNATFAAFSLSNTQGVGTEIDVEAGYNILHQLNVTTDFELLTAWKDSSDTSPSASVGMINSGDWGGVAIEIREKRDFLPLVGVQSS